MEAFVTHHGLVAPIDRPNVDTDAILPKQYLKLTERTGFGRFLFDAERYLDPGEAGVDGSSRRIDPTFVLNQPRYAGASILLARENFGCGSSREHAPWALREFGFRALLAPSFADIFATNCTKNGIVPVTLPTDVIDALFRQVDGVPGYQLTVDLGAACVITADGARHAFQLDAFRRRCLLGGLGEIELALSYATEIRAYEAQRSTLEPWVFDQP